MLYLLRRTGGIRTGKWGDMDFAANVRATLSRILKKGAVPVLVLNAPDFLKNPYEMAVKTKSTPGSERFFETEDFWTSDKVLASVAEDLGVQHFRPSDYLCRADRSCLFLRNNAYYYFDSGHFSYYGSRKIVEVMFNALGTDWINPQPN